MKQPAWKYLFSWQALAVWASALAWINWPLCDHWISYFWILITVATLAGELGNKLWSPKKQTLSDNVRDQKTESPIRFWIALFFWLGFAITLAVHFCIRGV